MQASMNLATEFEFVNKYNRIIKVENRVKRRNSLTDLEVSFIKGISSSMRDIVDYLTTLHISNKEKAKLVNRDKLIRTRYGDKVNFIR